LSKPSYVRLAPDWAGQDCFILAGGTSLREDLVQKLRGRANSKTLAVNSSYLVAPWADVLFFADERWWTRESRERPKAIQGFAGEIFTIAKHSQGERLLRLKRSMPPPGLATDRGTITMERTSLQGAVNIAVHRHARRIILLGADNRDGDNGRVHHHPEYPWPRKVSTWKSKEKQLKVLAAALAKLDVEVINASLISTLPFWPKVDFGAWLEEEEAK
jgi:hypothetical protein